MKSARRTAPRGVVAVPARLVHAEAAAEGIVGGAAADVVSPSLPRIMSSSCPPRMRSAPGPPS